MFPRCSIDLPCATNSLQVHKMSTYSNTFPSTHALLATNLILHFSFLASSSLGSIRFSARSKSGQECNDHERRERSRTHASSIGIVNRSVNAYRCTNRQQGVHSDGCCIFKIVPQKATGESRGPALGATVGGRWNNENAMFYGLNRGGIPVEGVNLSGS